MNRTKCHGCGFINFAGAVVCHKCQTALQNDYYQQQNYQQPQYYNQQTVPTDYNQQQQYYSQQQQQYYNQQQQYQYPQNYQYQNSYSQYAADNKKSSSKVGILVAVAIGIIVLGIIGAVAIPNMLGVGKKVEWQALKSERGKFSVMMPAKPKEASRPIAAGQTMYFYTAEVDKETGAMVAYIDFPPEAISRISTDKLLESAALGATTKSGAVIKSKKPITLQGHYQGLEMELLPPSNVGSGKGAVLCRVYIVNSRLYMLVITSEDRSPIMTESHKFFDSFQVL